MTEILESGFVVPISETPRHSLWLSNLDVVAARGHTPLVYFYGPNRSPDFFSTGVVKSALAKALVPFYPLAGRLGLDPTGRVEINCSAEGVLFVAARSESTLDEFKEFVPSKEKREMFVPSVDSADPPCVLLMIQVTHLKGGGAVLGFAIHHAAVDGRITFHFIKTWCAIARGASPLPHPPLLDRTLFHARSPPAVRVLNSEYTLHPFSSSSSSTQTTAAATLKLSSRQLALLKTRFGHHFTTFQAIVAHAWRCTCLARGLSPDQETKLCMAIDVRNRVNPPLPPHYLGNAVMRVPVSTTVADLVSDPVRFGAERIRSVTDGVGDEYVRSVIDYLELVDTTKLSSRSGLPSTKLCVVSWLRMPVDDADFGWGLPVFMSRAQLYGNGFLYLIQSLRKNGGIYVVVSLEQESMEKFKKLFYEPIFRSAI
ncbi:hydroxycinnamoyltransferase 4-like [Typha latifolia]|uniref:hydroxycinnamoyltransferase 4-like n=1 Tax=Typha latifolia TaxID=4733 RepID=UPI003C2C6406